MSQIFCNVMYIGKCLIHNHNYVGLFFLSDRLLFFRDYRFPVCFFKIFVQRLLQPVRIIVLRNLHPGCGSRINHVHPKSVPFTSPVFPILILISNYRSHKLGIYHNGTQNHHNNRAKTQQHHTLRAFLLRINSAHQKDSKANAQHKSNHRYWRQGKGIPSRYLRSNTNGMQIGKLNFKASRLHNQMVNHRYNCRKRKKDQRGNTNTAGNNPKKRCCTQQQQQIYYQLQRTD